MDVDDRVRAYVGSVIDGCVPERVTAVQRFAAGERHAVFRVTYADAEEASRDVVVRVSLGNDDAEREQAAREARLLDRVRGVAAPRLHDFRLDSPWFDAPIMCMELVPGVQHEMQTVAPDDVELLGGVVGRLHGLPIDDLADVLPDVGPEAYVDARLAQVAAYLPAVREPLPASVQGRLRDGVRRVHADRPTVGPDERLVLLHGDIATDNVIWSPAPVLIDWEYARVGDPADEIAYAFSQSALTAAQRDAFWRGYRATAASASFVDGVLARVAWWEPVTLLGSALWWVERWSHRVDADAAGVIDPAGSRAPDHYLDEALRRLDHFDALLESPQA